MRMAKASQQDVDKLRTWLQFNDELCKINPTSENDWYRFKKDWSSEDDFNKIIEHCECEKLFDWDYYMDYYLTYISNIHMRVIFGFELLLNNACDPELNYLDFNKEIKKGLELFYKEEQK